MTPPRHLPGAPRIAESQAIVAARFGTSVRELKSRVQCRRVARPRQIAMHLARKCTMRTCGEIARAFDRDHTTVLYADRMVRQLRASDQEFAGIVAQLEARLTALRCRCPSCDAEVIRFPLDPPQLLLPIAWPGELRLGTPA